MLEPGQIFAARYRVERAIAEGGMGAIFEAIHTATERRVALKLLFPHIMSVASARKKFELEAKISARVNSPFIVEVLDAGFDEGTKSPFLVMELLAGQTLAAHVQERGPLGVDEALPILEQLAAGLDAAHGYKEGGAPKPIVHRDLKPENLFLAREDEMLVLKILDFGIAKVLGESCNMSQEVRGTPLYMAFEQVTAGELSPQTDVWALGLIAYYTLAGQSYWRSATEQSANVQSLFAEILTLPLLAPSVRLRQQGSAVQLPAAFDSWLLTCLQRDPARRFASAGAAIDALAHAFGRAPRPRPRFSSMPAPSPAIALPPPPVLPEPTPLPPVATPATPVPPAAAAPARAAASPAAASPGAAGAAATGSLPAIASERAATPSAARLAPSRQRVAAGAGAAALLLGSLLWIAAGGRGPSGASAGAPGAAQELSEPVLEQSQRLSPAPALPARGEPAAQEPAPRLAPAEPPTELGANVAPASPGTGLTGSPGAPAPAEPLPEPRVRVALPEEIAPAAAEDPAVLPVPVAPVTPPAPPLAPERPVPTVAVAPALAVKPPATPAEKPAPRRKAYDSKEAYNTR